MKTKPVLVMTTELTDFFNEDAKWMELALSSFNFSAPAFIGCMISDKNGKTVAIFELFKGALEYFIKQNIKDIEKRRNFDIELIPMFICALELFSDNICIENLEGIKLKGTNIKMLSIFRFSQFTITLFLNPFIHIKSYENVIREYYSDLFEKFEEKFEDVLKFKPNDFISQIELKGREWLRELNESYLNPAKKAL